MGFAECFKSHWKQPASPNLELVFALQGAGWQRGGFTPLTGRGSTWRGTALGSIAPCRGEQREDWVSYL